jgi:phage portal protein BeeE
MQATAGTSREPIVLPQSVKWQQVQISPDDSQFIELMQFDEVALCRFFGLQPSSVGVQGGGSSLTYANREQDKQQELQDAMLPPMIRLEEAMSDLLPGDLAVKFNPAGLLRADLAARYASYEASARVFASTGYWIVTPEEWRDLEDREPLPDASGGSEASEMINAAGGTLPVPAPAELMKGVS